MELTNIWNLTKWIPFYVNELIWFDMVYEVMLLFFKQIKKFIKWKLGKNPLVVCLIMLCFLYHHMKKKKNICFWGHLQRVYSPRTSHFVLEFLDALSFRC